MARENVRLLNLAQQERSDLSYHQPISAAFAQQSSTAAQSFPPASLPAVKPDHYVLPPPPLDPKPVENSIEGPQLSFGLRNTAWQMMEEMGLDAVNEIADRVFQGKRELNCEEWEEICVVDVALMGWLELFGLIF